MTRLASALLLAALAAAPVLAQTADASRIPDDAPTWLSMADAIQQARDDQKLILVHTYAVWCGWCVRMDQETYADDAVQAYLAEHYTATRVDLESDSTVAFFDRTFSMHELGNAFGVSGTPTSVFVDPSGELITKLPGFADAATFALALRYVREGAFETSSFREYVDAHRAEPAGE